VKRYKEKLCPAVLTEHKVSLQVGKRVASLELTCCDKGICIYCNISSLENTSLALEAAYLAQ